MFSSSMSTDKIDTALSKAQGEIEVAVKNANNQHFKSTYANLTAVWDACKKALTKHGVLVTQWPIHSEDTRAHLLTRVSFQGEFYQSEFSTPVTKQDPQGFKSAITYLKRVGLEAALGISSEDDDANEASSAEDCSSDAEVKPKTQERPPTEPQLKRLFAIMKKCGIKPEELQLVLDDFYGVVSSKDLSRVQYDEICTLMDTKAPKEIFDMALQRAIDRGAVKS